MMNKPKTLIILFATLLAIWYYLLMSQYICAQDDLTYHFRLDNGQPVNTISDIIISNCYGYLHDNGRFIVHCLTQLMCSANSIVPFCVVSTFCFIMMVIGCARLSCGRQCHFVGYVSMALTLVLLLPLPGVTMFGHIAFVINYMWTGCAIVWFLVCYREFDKNHSIVKKIILYVLATICGSFQESFSMGVCAGILADLAASRRHLNPSKLKLAICFFFGTEVCVLAPGNFQRLGEAGFETSIIRRFILVSGETWVVWILMLATIMLTIYRRERTVEFLKNNLVYYVSTIVSYLFSVIIAYTYKHQLFPQILMSVIILFAMQKHFAWFANEKSRNAVAIASSVILMLMFFPMHNIRNKAHDAYNLLLQRAEMQTEGYVVANEYIEIINSPLINSFFAKYLTPANSQVYSKKGIVTLSKYMQKIEGKNRLDIVLPASPTEIANLCSGHIFETDTYFVVKKRGNEDLPSLRIFAKPVIFSSKMLNYLSKQDFRIKTIEFDDLDIKFQHQSYQFAIIYKYLYSGYSIDHIEFR